MDLSLFHHNIVTALSAAENVADEEIAELIKETSRGEGLTLSKAAKLLLHADLPTLTEQAIQVKEKKFGQRTAIFAPLYLTNICRNNCLYCGFRFDNKELLRRQLDNSEIEAEARILSKTGHRIVLLICGDDPQISRIEYLTAAIKTVLNTHGITRVNIEVAPLDTEEYYELKAAGAGTYILFQETYNPDTYKTMHPQGPKANFVKRINAPLKAAAAGFTEVGLGILLGLRHYHYDFLGMIAHAWEIRNRYGFFPSSFSLPRLKPALNAPLQVPPHPLSDDEFQRVAALLRLTFPDSEIILTTRESPDLRNRMMRSGISMFSAGSKTYPGGYSESNEKTTDKEQFHLDDLRSLEEIVTCLVEAGELPSFQEALSCKETNLSQAVTYQKNALLSFADYLAGHANPVTCEKGSALIRHHLPKINDRVLQGQISRILEQVGR